MLNVLSQNCLAEQIQEDSNHIPPTRIARTFSAWKEAKTKERNSIEWKTLSYQHQNQFCNEIIRAFHQSASGPLSSIKISDLNHWTVRMKTITKIKMALNNSRIAKTMMKFFLSSEIHRFIFRIPRILL